MYFTMLTDIINIETTPTDTCTYRALVACLRSWGGEGVVSVSVSASHINTADSLVFLSHSPSQGTSYVKTSVHESRKYE